MHIVLYIASSAFGCADDWIGIRLAMLYNCIDRHVKYAAACGFGTEGGETAHPTIKHEE